VPKYDLIIHGAEDSVYASNEMIRVRILLGFQFFKGKLLLFIHVKEYNWGKNMHCSAVVLCSGNILETVFFFIPQRHGWPDTF
jgi:hypothetical protein